MKNTKNNHSVPKSALAKARAKMAEATCVDIMVSHPDPVPSLFFDEANRSPPALRDAFEAVLNVSSPGAHPAVVRLFELERANPEHMRRCYEAVSMVVMASSEARARKLANENCAEEGCVWGGEDVTCTEIDMHVEGLVSRSIDQD